MQDKTNRVWSFDSSKAQLTEIVNKTRVKYPISVSYKCTYACQNATHARHEIAPC